MANKETQKTIWLSYDLGFKGDYPGLYNWLAKYEAKECGDSLAVFKVKINGDIIVKLTKEIKENVSLNSSDRIYIIYKDDTGLVKGKFVNGRRKRAAWDDYIVKEAANEEDV